VPHSHRFNPASYANRNVPVNLTATGVNEQDSVLNFTDSDNCHCEFQQWKDITSHQSPEAELQDIDDNFCVSAVEIHDMTNFFHLLDIDVKWCLSTVEIHDMTNFFQLLDFDVK
jgi:hypothetical protein